jgi:hypothetical protein
VEEEIKTTDSEVDKEPLDAIQVEIIKIIVEYQKN